ncbi:MAG TPA: ATP-binding cassette domain-containing protein [Bryobacteraceae bacterium]|nr:ATP-binding cassette domain-containing protein [Bryobacteraceae bacterium]
MIEILRPWKGRLGLIMVAVLAEMAFNAVVPLGLRFVIDQAITPHNYTALVEIITGLIFGAVIVSGVGFVRNGLFSVLQGEVILRLRQLMFDHAQRLSLASHAGRAPGEILSRFTSDVTSVETAMGMSIPWGVQPLCEAVTASLILFALDWRLASAAMILWPWTILAPRRLARRAAIVRAENKNRESELLGTFGENLVVQPVIKAFNLQSLMGTRFSHANHAAARTSEQASYLTSVMERLTTGGILLIQMGVLAASARLAFQGRMSVGTLVSLQGLLLMLSNSLLYVMQFAPTLVQARTCVRRIQDFLEEPEGVTDLPHATVAPPFSSKIEMGGVDFGYTREQLNLTGINITIRRGESVAFVGGSGSGKSTALALLLRFYDPVRGEVRVDGRAMTSLGQASLRAQMGVVFQDSFLLNLSVRENIRLGNPGASDDEIVTAAKSAEIHDAIMAMPQQYDSLAGERGGRLSGGQRQRIAIARAIVKNPPILLLDEATSALDPATETLINRTLRRLGEGRTVISVTHRLAAVTTTDRIFVFSAGTIVESGAHAQLVAAGGPYAQLWARQSGFSMDPDGVEVSITPERLGAFPVFSELGPDLLASAARQCRKSTWQPGENVFLQGDPGNLFYVIVRGRFQVIRHDIVLATLEDGDCFGEVALVTDLPRNATVRALTPAVVLTLSREIFLQLLQQSRQTHDRIRSLVHERAGSGVREQAHE